MLINTEIRVKIFRQNIVAYIHPSGYFSNSCGYAGAYIFGSIEEALSLIDDNFCDDPEKGTKVEIEITFV